MAESIYYSQIDDQSEDIDYEGSIEEETRIMKIDHNRVRKSTSEPPSECKALIDRLKKCNRIQLLEELARINTWTFGKCELGHWKDVLNIFDSILDEATEYHVENRWALNCDWKYSNSDKKLLLWILHFTTLLIEHSFSRHTYKSMTKLLTLLGSSDMCVVLGVLNLLYIFSKRSNFITRMHHDQRMVLISRLHHLAESWGGKENGFGLADCCDIQKPMPPSATTLHFEFHNEQADTKGKQNMTYIHVEHVDQIRKTPAEIMKGLVSIYLVPVEKEMLLFTHVRLAYHFSNYKNRLLCVQARLQALSVLVYANALQDSAHTLLYNGLLEELVELIELKFPYLVEIRSAALRTLTSIIHLDRNPHFPKKPGSRLNNIIDVTGASQYHGFLPVLVRYCISCLTSQTDNKDNTNKDNPSSSTSSNKELEKFEDAEDIITIDEEYEPYPYLNTQSTDAKGKFPQPLATALFSFLYHLASYEAGGDALVSCGMMESLLQVINWHGVELEHITFVTRAVRVIDLITNIDMQAFYTHGGLQSFVNRLDVEVNLCVKEHAYEFKYIPVDTDTERPSTSDSSVQSEDTSPFEFLYNPENAGKTCLPQRAALLKSMLNFLKKALQDTTFSEHIRHLMETTLPNSLKHIISNAEYYGPSLFLLATDVVTVYVFQEPSLLSTIQDNGLTDVVLQALLVKDVPATREVLASLPNVFSALCLNARGLASFIKCKPFERLFKVLLSPTYLSAMRKRRSSDPMGDAASNLGNAMDELMRHQPSLKVDATAAIIKLLNELCQLGSDSKYICWRPHSKTEASPTNTQRTSTNTEGSSDDEEDDDEEEASTSSQTAQSDSQESQQAQCSEKTPIALTEYILNVTKFIDAILSNNSTDDHCKEFVSQDGLVPLLKILGLPNLPVDCPVTNSAQAVASVCKSILNLAHEPKVLEQGLAQLEEVLVKLKPLYSHLNIPGGSKLLHELANAPHLETAFSTESATPLLHAMGAAHGYVLMFVHVCRTSQNEIRTLSLQHWGSEKGILVLKGLAELYTSLVWESTLLLALCSDDVISSDCDFGRDDMEKLNIPIPEKPEAGGDSAGNVASAMEALTTNPQSSVMEVDTETNTGNKPTSQQLKYIKPLLGASSRLGRALAELFGLLVKLCVGSPIRQRRGQNTVAAPAFPSPHAQSVATALNSLLANGLNSDKLPPSPVPKFRLTFLICSVGFTSPMLFDEKRYPYHLMLQKFVSLGGQSTFFSTFRWALSAAGTIPLEEGIEHPNLPEGTGEFLDAWLTLLEKMVNPKAILDSPHVITTKSQTALKAIAFDPLKYLVQIHRLAFESVMLLWGKKPLPSYGVRMSESMLSILRHILRGEKIIKDRMNKSEEKSLDGSSGSANSSGSSNSRGEAENVNPESLRQLMDMGFSREHAMEALMHSMSVEQATDYLLSNPPSLLRVTQAGMEIDMSEDDQVIQAIAMSLGEAGPSTEAKKKEEEEIIPLSEELIDNFTQGALQICLDLIEVIPESVFKVCDLLVTIMKRNGQEFRDRLLQDFCNMLTGIYMTYEPSLVEDNDSLEKLDLFATSVNSLRLAYYTHLFTLFFEVPPYFDMRGPCGLAVYQCELVPRLIKLLYYAEKVMRRRKRANVPKWLTPVLLLLDSLGKVAISTQRKRHMHLVTIRNWKWYDVVSGKWTEYSCANNKIINDAYWNGEQTTRITCGRRRYTISFTNMQQVNEESNYNRPICMTPVNMALNRCVDVKPDFFDGMENEQMILTEKEEKRCVPIVYYTTTQAVVIVRSCVKLMNTDIDKDTLHAIMRLTLRLTQDFEVAKVFVREGGVTCILQLKESMAFIGFRTLATLLIRHTVEGPGTLAYAMEKVIRGRALPSTPPPYKELVFMLRSLGSAVSRDPTTFLDVAKQTLRIDINSFRRSDEADSRMPIKTEPSNRTHAPLIKDQESIDVIHEMLNALILPIEVHQPEEDTFDANKHQPSGSIPKDNTRESMCQRASYLLSGNNASGDILNVDGQEENRQRLARTVSDTNMENKPREIGHRPILAKHNVLKMLADSVVSYSGVAKLVTEHSYKAASSDFIQEDCSCLAFLFDKILPIVEEVSDRDCSMTCRNLISGIASCNHSPEAQSTLVTEVKAALIRALLLPESGEKHKRLQHITGIILNMIEQCPPVQQVRIFKSETFNANVNNIARLMLRKGIFNDLARVPHCLDMSSPNFPITINSALKPMECLSKIVNQPVTGNVTGNVNKKRQRHAIDDAGATHSGTTSTEATNAQGEEAVEDTENTEHDLSAVASSLEGNPMASGMPDDNVLEEIMERLLEREPNAGNATMEIDDDPNLGYDHERDATEELMSTDSGDSEDDVDEEDNEEENEVDDGDADDNDDNDDDDDEEEELDEGDDEEDNNYDDFENAPNMDRDEDIVMIQYPDDSENDSFPVVRWNESGFSIPLLDDSGNAGDQTAPATHPLLVSRHNIEGNSGTVTRAQRANRTRRYQYLQLNPRNSNPPVILQRRLFRLLGPTAQNLHLSSPGQMLNSPGLRDSARVVVMDNIGIFPSVEEQIDFVDQSGYLFGPSMMATINHIPVALHWWKEESRFIDGESMHDVVIYLCNVLIPTLVRHKIIDIAERKRKTDVEDGKGGKGKSRNSDDKSDDALEPPDSGGTAGNSDSMDQTARPEPQQNLADDSDEDIDGVPIDEPNLTDSILHQPQAPDNQSEQQPIRVVNILADIQLQNMGSSPPPLQLINVGREDEHEQNDQPEDHEDEHDEDREEDNDENQETSNTLFSNMYHNSHSLLSAPSILMPLFRYSTDNENQELTSQESDPGNNQQQASTSSQRPNNGDGASTPQGSEQASSSQDATASSDNTRNSEMNDDIPEGVDPSFLDALPPEMRREVLDQHRLLRLQQRISMNTSGSDQSTAATGGSNEVSPEFLAALPPSLQEEVLTQQRLEQQRQAAARANPDEPVDAGAFFETLQPSLRTMILSDMEDSQMSVLPPDLAAEAQTLRRDWEARNRQIVQERFFQSNLTTIIRHSARGGRLGSRFNTLLPHRQQWNWNPRDINPQSSSAGNSRIRGRQLLDHESLSCLLVLLFVDDPKLNTGRLHRVIRNLCYHVQTRDWVVKALLSIIDRSVHVKPDDSLNKPKRLPRPGPLTSKLLTDAKNIGNGANWLNIRMEAALGCHANVFIVTKVSGKRTNTTTISIHPQAAPVVCRNALDLFTSLSRSFPTFLLPLKPKDKNKTAYPLKIKGECTDFWDMLLKLDAASTKKGKSLAKTHSSLNLSAENENTTLTFEQSAFGQLILTLSSPVIQSSINLTDKLLRLLSVISMGMPELTKGSESSRTNRNTAQNFESVSAPERALNLAVNVLTYKSCSEEGLEEVTTLLLNLSNCSVEMSFTILNLLLKGALRIGEIVRVQIQDMLEELKNVHKYQHRKPIEEPNPSTSKGTVNNRFTRETVIITASSKVKASCDLQLPSMVPLTSKSSSQIFFLRVLRVIVQIRDAIKKTLEKEDRPPEAPLNALSDQLEDLENLWNTLSHCLLELEHTPDHHAVLVLQPAVEAFFLVHSPVQDPNAQENKTNVEPAQDSTEQAAQSVQPTSTSTDLSNSSEGNNSGRISVPPDQQKFLNFAEKHRTVLNQILRQTTAHLADGPFSVLVDHTRVLDFDIKRRYFRTELERLDQNLRREETAVHVRREHVFEDSFRELYRRTPEEWKNRFYIVFEDEEGQDAGGLLREWYMIISRDIFNPMYALFTVSPGDRVTYMINPASHYNPNHLCYYKFVGRVIAKAIYDNKLLECYFTRSFYKHILGISVKYTDMESEDYSFYRGLVYLMENNINDLGCDLTFSTEINEFGVTETRDLIPNGRNVPVTEENKMEYVRRSCQMKMTGAIRQQLTAFLEGFYDIIPKRLISIFNEQELELLISGLPNVDIEDLKANTEYHKYQATSLQIQWFWRALRSFDQADRAKFLQFVTGTSKVPLQGFGALEGMNGVQRFQIHRDDRSTDRLPSAHTCFNQLDLPVYETYDKLRSYLLKAIHECSEGFGFA